MESHHSISQWVGNVIGVSAIVSTVIGWLPAIAAAIAVVWYAIQIYESVTVRAWLAKRQVHRIARLKARLMILESKPAPLPPGMEDKL